MSVDIRPIRGRAGPLPGEAWSAWSVECWCGRTSSSSPSSILEHATIHEHPGDRDTIVVHPGRATSVAGEIGRSAEGRQ
jgi:hypothetical protein